MAIQLSYIIATRNRLPFLQITLGRLINILLPDEEIVIVDGDSTDGTREYLQQLFNEGKIHQYLSEPDKNQAHGWNKAFLMAKGTIIKKIIDDDVFCYAAIRQCKDHMLANPDVDVVISNDLDSVATNHTQIQERSRLKHFEQWKNGITPSFTFSDVHMLIKRSSLPYLGLYYTGFTMMDYEYALRISYLQANIVYYTGYNALSVAHPQTVTSQVDQRKFTDQGLRANHYYEYPGDGAQISLWSKIKIAMGKRIFRAKPNNNPELKDIDLNSVYQYHYNYIDQLAARSSGEFIRKQ
ncbi:glycosyltransferase [Mucilaginibacter myungsuensis]|uniref:Glycosyltransferase n=1 Tax=Mucilaginibacter myungsuensis TaxID=649104 RepID=A0A929PUJ5_9SPHI|nr:glycosyltransferase [Mucilaginibacter myungsuensis]MBE9660828.1 glycosyltransferase [Mucilaginibacter myungsuensis]MDN3600875.1 glycosyltransferase [Mucilaginibacter myungsuensis]